MAKREKNIIEIIHDVSNQVAAVSIDAASIPDGFYCELYYPLGPVISDVRQVFKDDSQDFRYNKVYDKKGQYIILGILNDLSKPSDQSTDPYAGIKPYILTKNTEKIPVNTRVVVFRSKIYTKYKVIDHSVYPSTEVGQIYFKNFLVPWN